MGNSGLFLNKYNGSILQLLKSIYPDYEWLPWKFSQYPRNFWDDMQNQREYLDWVETQLNIKNKEDWYRITTNVILC